MRGNRRRALTVTAALASLQTTVFLLATRVLAAPNPSPSPKDNCDLIVGPAKNYCQSGDKAGSGAPKPPAASPTTTPSTPSTPSPRAAPKPPPGSSPSSPTR